MHCVRSLTYVSHRFCVPTFDYLSLILIICTPAEMRQLNFTVCCIPNHLYLAGGRGYLFFCFMKVIITDMRSESTNGK